MRARGAGVLVGICVAAAAGAWAQAPITENTVRLADGATSPQADLSGLAWLVGQWSGEGLGGQIDEIWTAPQGGAMLGMFRLTSAGAPRFYELMTMVEERGSVRLRLKHFNPDLTGWEEKGEAVEFPLVAVAGDRWLFDGLTIHRQGDDAMTIYVAISAADGTVREGAFSYTRVRGQQARPIE